MNTALNARLSAVAASVSPPAVVHDRPEPQAPLFTCISKLGTLTVDVEYRAEDDESLCIDVERVCIGGQWIAAHPDEFSIYALAQWEEDAMADYLRAVDAVQRGDDRG
jgi:hypothetical protein